jgi:CBS domain-containing protein
MLRVRDIMTQEVTTLAPETTVREAMELLARQHISGAPVVSGNRVLGVVTDADLLSFASSVRGVPVQRDEDVEFGEWRARAEDRDAGEGAEREPDNDPSSTFFSDLWEDAGADVAERMAAIEGPEWNVLEEHDVSEVMTRDLWTLPPNADARAAADLMRRNGIHRVLVVENDELVGIVSAIDIARAVADKRFSTRTYVFNRDRDFGRG